MLHRCRLDHSPEVQAISDPLSISGRHEKNSLCCKKRLQVHIYASLLEAPTVLQREQAIRKEYLDFA